MSPEVKAAYLHFLKDWVIEGTSYARFGFLMAFNDGPQNINLRNMVVVNTAVKETIDQWSRNLEPEEQQQWGDFYTRCKIAYMEDEGEIEQQEEHDNR